MLARIIEKIRAIGRLAPIGIATLLLPVLGSSLLLVFVSPLGGWMRDNWEAGIGIFLAGVLVFCGLALLPTNAVGLLGGWAFSFDLGLAVLIIGIVGASYISFSLGSRLSGDRLAKTLNKHSKSSAIHKALLHDNVRRATLIVFLLRMSVIMPFALTNFLLAASRVPSKAFLLGTAVGMFPRAAAMAYLGSGLSELDLSNARDTTTFAIGVGATIISIATIAIISRKALERLTISDTNAAV